MKFLHISDMHFDPQNDGEDTNLLREKFINYLEEKNIVVDELFFTGDFRHALKQKDQQEEEVAQNACDFLMSIALSAVKDTSNIYRHIHIVPGNHDLLRGDIELLDRIYKEYDSDKANFKEIIKDGRTGLNILLSRFSFFERCARLLRNDVWTDLLNEEVCHVREMDDCSIVYINTAIASGRENERGNLYVGRQYIANAFRQAIKRNPHKPIIVLAHNIIDDIQKEERIKIKNFINDIGVPVVWLCGDSHGTEYNNSYNVAYITAGCLLQERGTEASFFVGEINDNGLSFEAHGYDKKNSGWEYKEIVTKRVNNSLPDILKTRKKKLKAINNLLPQNKYFWGRQKELNEIDKIFRQKEVTAVNICQTISGLGGVGKTQLALEYGYRFGGNYSDAVWFIAADGPTSIYNSFFEFAMRMGIHLSQKCKIGDLQAAIRNWLICHDEWLLIVDNLESFDDIEPYLPNIPKGHFIITTRNVHIDMGVRYSIDVFTEIEAINFIRNRIYGLGDKKEYDFDDFEIMAPELVKRLGNLPLALEQAGAYISMTKCSISEYLKLLEEYGLDMFKEDEEYSLPSYYEKVVNTTWNISISNIADDGAKQLFYLCSYMDSERIPVDFFVQTRDKLSKPLCDELRDGRLKNRIVTELRNYSLTSGNAEYINIHRLVQEVVRNELGDDEKWINICYVCMGEYLPTKYEEKQTRIQFREISNHCESILKYTKKVKKDEFYANYLFNMGYGYYINGNYKKAYEAHLTALNVRKKVDGEKQQLIACSYNHVGLSCFYIGNYGQAIEYYKRAIEIIREIEICKEELAQLYNNLALVYRRQGEYKDAIDMYINSLKIKKQIYAYENNSIAESYNNIGVAYYWWDNCEEAIKWHFEAKRIREHILPQTHPDLAETYNNIGVVYFRQEKYAEAYKYYKMALDIREDVLGKDHPETTMTYDNIASYYAVIKEYGKAIDYFNKALEVRLDKLGENHVDTAATYNNMAYVYRHRNDDADMTTVELQKVKDDEKAIEYYRKALDIFTNNFGKDHPHTKVVSQNLHEMLSGIGRK